MSLTEFWHGESRRVSANEDVESFGRKSRREFKSVRLNTLVNEELKPLRVIICTSNVCLQHIAKI